MFRDAEIRRELDEETRLKLEPHRAGVAQAEEHLLRKQERGVSTTPSGSTLRAPIADLIHPHMRQALLFYAGSKS